ncbi:MAG: hypothetical protein ACI30B_03760 [Paludibacteraceae bacterium]
MKRKIIKGLILIWLLMPMCCVAQKTKLKKCSMTVYYSNMDFYHNGVEYDVPVYYDDDDNEVKHGAFNVVDNFSKNGVVLTYKASGNYINRKLHGSVTLEKNEKIPSRKVSVQIKGTVNYENGVPNGKWTFSEIGTLGSKKETKSCTMVFKNGYLVSYNNNDNYNFTLNENLNLTGKIDGIEYEKGINMTYFVRKTGSNGELEENQKMLLKDFLSGKTTKEDLMNEGYIFELERAPIISSDLTGYFGELQIGEFSEDPYERIMPQFAGDYVELTLERISYPQKLKRVNIISIDEVIKKLEAIDFYKFNFRTFYCDEFEFGFDFSRNNMKYYRGNYDEYYYTDETKAKIIEYIEERRLEILKAKATKSLEELFNRSKDYKVEILSSFYPIMNHEILDIESTDNGLIVKCKLNKFISKKEGYETYKTEVFFDKNGNMQSSSFNFKEAVKVENDWDKIRSLNSQIETNKAKILGEKEDFLSDIKSAYTGYHKSCNLKVGDNTNDCITRLESLVKVQNQCLEFIEFRRQINTNDVEILAFASSKNVVNLYSKYFKSRDITWTSVEIAKDKLHEVIVTQEIIKQNLSTEYAVTWDLAVAEEKIYDINTALRCFETINLRKQRNDNNTAIMAHAKQCKNIVKIYAAYFKKLDFTWTSADTSKTKFEEVIANQEIIRKAIESANATELDNAIKKEKIKDIQTLVNRLK